MQLRHLLIGTVLASSLPVLAQAESQGFYMGGAGGVVIPRDSKIKNGILNDKIEYDLGYAGSVSLGYDFGSFRTELEGSLRGSDVDDLERGTFRNPGGDTQLWGVLFNAIYDVETGTAFTPYLGAGVGLGIVDSELTGNGGTVYQGTDTTLAYQGIAGVAYALSPQLSLTADYRYFDTKQAEFNAPGTRWKVRNASHTVFAGVRYTFGAAAPMMPQAEAPPQPAPAPKTEYLVFFDFDKSTVTPEAREIIREAAVEAGRTRTVSIIVTGHTDTSGSIRYNQRLGERRATAVASELTANGVSPSMIQTISRGETELLTRTADGVREPSNRRAQIVLRVE